jgi:hydroxymethylglutaryl-CoA lyase
MFRYIKNIFNYQKNNNIKIVEVSLRDGIQGIKEVIPTNNKYKLMELLINSGIKHIEAGSFVSNKIIQQFDDTSDILKYGKSVKYNLSYPKLSVLVPSTKFLKLAIDEKNVNYIDEIAVFTSVSDEFNKKNINCTIEESKIRILNMIKEIKHYNNKNNTKPILIRGYISCIAGCPYIGNVDNSLTINLCNWMIENGINEVSLGDTIGIGTPSQIKKLMKELKKNNIDFNKLAVHFHDTNNRAIDNIKIALEYGIRTIDTSVGDIGGCPFAKKDNHDTSIGNVSTVRVVKELQRLGYNTGINLEQLMIADEYARSKFLNVNNYSQNLENAKITKKIGI